MFALAEALPHSDIRVLRSKFGHDAFLTETLEIGNILERSLRDACGGAA